MKKVKTIYIGIPTFNEEKNIAAILKDLTSQRGNNFIVKKIIVFDDASSDQTLEKIKQLRNKNILIFSNKVRVGKSKNLNFLLKNMIGDINILCDADVRIKDKFFLSKLTDEFNLHHEGLVACQVAPINNSTLFERVMHTSVTFKEYIKRYWNNGDNYLAFSGAFLALSKEFTREVTIPDGIKNDDAYIYFASKKLGFKTKYIHSLIVSFYSPQNLADHINQSSRFKSSYTELHKYFGKRLSKEYQIPKAVLFKSAITSLIDNTFLFLSYVIVLLMTYLFQDKKISHLWDAASSTKGHFRLW